MEKEMRENGVRDRKIGKEKKGKGRDEVRKKRVKRERGEER